MTLQVSDFRTRFPEFSDDTEYPDARIQLFLDDALEDVDQTKNKQSVTDRMTAYLTAHYLQLSIDSSLGNAGNVAPVSSHSEGEVSTSYAVNPATNDLKANYGSTVYGQQFQTLLRLYGVSMVTCV